MVSFQTIYDQFLRTITSCTLSQCTDEEIEAQLSDMLLTAITQFKFPKVKLDYELNIDGEYVFNNDITQKEIVVLIKLMRKEWVSYQLTKESNYQEGYYDANARRHSKANLIAQLNRLFENISEDAEDTEREYYKVNRDGRPALGDIKW